MNCRRCQGCMILDHIVDLLESGGEWWTASWRCINCGYALDPVLEQNRRRQQTAVAEPSVSQDQDSREKLPKFEVAA